MMQFTMRTLAMITGLIGVRFACHLDRVYRLADGTVHSHRGGGAAGGGGRRVFLHCGLVGAPGFPLPADCGRPGLQTQQSTTTDGQLERAWFDPSPAPEPK